MSRTRTLRFLLAATAASWAMIFVAILGTIALHLADRPRPRVVVYQEAYARPVLVQTPHGVRCCCPPPPCCPHAVAYVPYAPTPRPPVWPLALLGLLGASAIVSSIVSSRRVVPMQP